MIAHNNLFNVRYRKGVIWLGQYGQTKGFITFTDREYGIRCFFVTLRTYRRKHHIMTIRGIISRFAPPSENNTQAYIVYCCGIVHVTRDDVLMREDYVRLATAMAKYETGTNLSYEEALRVCQKFNCFPI